MNSPPDLKLELVGLLRAELLLAEKTHRTTTEAATHEEAKPENDKDTRALEQSYLARGQALRVEELRLAVAEVESMRAEVSSHEGRVVLGARVTVVDERERPSTYWLAPHGGGNRLAGGRVQVVTPLSPVGRALVGKAVGDEVDVATAGTTRSLTVVSIG